MSPPRGEIAEQYRARLRQHLERGGEESLHQAYELGRRALSGGTGILGMSSLHHRVAREALETAGASPEVLRILEALQTFFVESVTPHEMALRDSREASAAWRQLNERLEAEARRIAHALHDEAGQMLATAHISLEGLASDLPSPERNRVKEIRSYLHRIEDQLRRISHELRPTILDDLGLVPALEFLAEGVSQRGGLTVEVEGRMDKRLPAPLETALYRVVQEALTNVGRHAKATRATVRLNREGGEVRCVVRDNGVGFEPSRPSAAATGGGLGLIGMKERVSAAGGSLRISARPARGTALSIRIPLGDEDAASRRAGR
jgi:two-component system sensor histidine kinase UhpB